MRPRKNPGESVRRGEFVLSWITATEQQLGRYPYSASSLPHQVQKCPRAGHGRPSSQPKWDGAYLILRNSLCPHLNFGDPADERHPSVRPCGLNCFLAHFWLLRLALTPGKTSSEGGYALYNRQDNAFEFSKVALQGARLPTVNTWCT